jgi:hypothetical protein
MTYRKKTKTNRVSFSPQANYTDRAIAGGQGMLMSTFADRGVSRGQRGDSA